MPPPIRPNADTVGHVATPERVGGGWGFLVVRRPRGHAARDREGVPRRRRAMSDRSWRPRLLRVVEGARGG